MNKVVAIVEQFLRRHPTPTKIQPIGQLLKLSHNYHSPYTNSTHPTSTFIPLQSITSLSPILKHNHTLIYHTGRIQQSQSFDSVPTKQQHQQIMQDDCFGKPNHTQHYSRWAYVAQIKDKPLKSVFNSGIGKEVFMPDLGEGYEGIKKVAIFIWDKKSRKTYQVKIDQDLIPAHVTFSNEQGSEIIFHAYKKQHFGYGILHCLNRPVGIYKAVLTFEINKNSNSAQNPVPFEELKSEVIQIVKDEHQTNMFPTLSPCFNYLTYLSGTGITHAYYLDFVVAIWKEGKWVESYRLKQKVVGFYDTLKSYIYTQEKKTFGVFQTYEQSTCQIYKLGLQSKELENITVQHKNVNFSIQDVTTNGLILGTATTHSFNSFFYVQNQQVQIVEPRHRENFTVKEYSLPIPASIISAQIKDIQDEYQVRAKCRPLVILLHGGPHACCSPTLTALRYSLLKLGYSLLLPNFPGSTSYGQNYLESSLGDIGNKDVKPLMQLLGQVLSDDKTIDKDRVHVMGGSYGGYLSAVVGSRYSKHFKSAVIMNGVINNAANLWFTDIPEWITAETLKKKQLNSLTNQEYTQFIRQSAAAEPMRIPTLQFLGAKDRRVPYRQGLFFDAITKEVGTSITTYVYEESSHSLSDSVETSIDITVKTIDFLEKQTQNK